MIRQIEEILLNNASKRGEGYTHVTMGAMKGCYSLSLNSIDRLYTLYQYSILRTNKKYYIAERAGQFSQLVFDIDIKQALASTNIKEGELVLESNEEKKNKLPALYTKDAVVKFIKIVIHILKKHINLDEKMFTSVWLYKKPYEKKKFVKHGFHVQFPFIFLDKQQYNTILLPQIIDLTKQNNLFKSVKHKLLTSNYNYDIDKAAMTNNWLLYGSMKDEFSGVYEVKSIFDKYVNEISPIEAFSNYKLFRPNRTLIKLDTEELIKRNYPRILSIIPLWRKKSIININNFSNATQVIPETSFLDSSGDHKKMTPVETLNMLEKIMPLLSRERSDVYDTWIHTGWALHSITGGSIEGYNYWLEFSKKSRNFDQKACEDRWSKMVAKPDKKITIGTLIKYAKDDSPDKFKKIFQTDENSLEYLIKNGMITECDIAKYMFSTLDGKFVCCNINKKRWWTFKKHVWRLEKICSTLRLRISSDIPIELDILIKKYCKLLNEMAGNDSRKKSLEEDKKRCYALRNKCRQTTFKNNVMRELAELCEDVKFEESLDSIDSIIGLRNGIYDFKEGKFREGRPSDRVSKQMNARYLTKYNYNHPSVKKIEKFLRQIHPDKKLFEFFMHTTCNILIGGNFNKRILFWTGNGDNGKSQVQNLLQNLLGNGTYCVTFPTTLFTSKKPPNGSALPELARAGRGVRWGIIVEPEADEQLQISFLKTISGGDPIYCRGLYEEGGEIIPKFKVVIICNDLPKIKNSDKAWWNRCRIIPFESTFNWDAPKSEAEQIRQKIFPRIQNISQQLDVEAFCWYLINYYMDNVKGKNCITEPEKVKAATTLYRQNNDYYRQFIKECVITQDMVPEEKEIHLTLNELYSNYKDWHKEGVSNHNIPVRNDVKEAIRKIWGDPVDTSIIMWKGYRMRRSDDSRTIRNTYRQ